MAALAYSFWQYGVYVCVCVYVTYSEAQVGWRFDQSLLSPKGTCGFAKQEQGQKSRARNTAHYICICLCFYDCVCVCVCNMHQM